MKDTTRLYGTGGWPGWLQNGERENFPLIWPYCIVNGTMRGNF